MVKVNWEKELSETLRNVYQGKTESDYFKSLSKMVAKLEDGHGVIFTDKIAQWGLPFMVAWIENNIVVTATSDTTSFKLGDIIANIDGKSSYEELQAQESLISGSPQLRRYRALNMFGSDFTQSEANIKIIRNYKELTQKVKRQTKCNLFFNPLFKGFSTDFLDFGKNIYYFNNYSCDNKSVMDTMVGANGIIINGASELFNLIPHIIKQPVCSARWNIPVTAYPDRINTSFDTSGRWTIEPKEPYIKAKLIFLTHPYNVSSGETFFGIIDNYKLGKLVGDTTAGTNGNANYIPLMGGYNIMWTGMKVLKHNGSQHHLTGFRPQYPVRRIIDAIKEGRDEYIEKAKEVLIEEVKK